MQEWVNALEQRLTMIEDRAAIRDLITSYGRLADAGHADAVAQLWTADGTYEVVGFATATGHAEIASLITGPVHQALMADGCAHVMGQLNVEVSGDSATARGHSLVLRHRSEAGEPGTFEVYRVSANCWTLARTAEGWRVTHRANSLLNGNEAARILLAP